MLSNTCFLSVAFKSKYTIGVSPKVKLFNSLIDVDWELEGESFEKTLTEALSCQNLKKFLVFFLVITIVVGLVGCNKTEKVDSNESTTSIKDGVGKFIDWYLEYYGVKL